MVTPGTCVVVVVTAAELVVAQLVPLAGGGDSSW